MAPRKSAQPSPAAAPPSSAKSPGTTSSPSSPLSKSPNKLSSPPHQRSSPSSAQSSSIRNAQDAQQILRGVWNHYVERTPQRTKLIDVFMAFLMLVGGLQFLYCVVAGNYPFNAFLAGFSCTVGQFVLTASLRIQTNEENRAEFEKISHERAFADFVFGSMILHFFCVNFIN